MNRGILPTGWREVALDEVVRTSSGGTPSSKNLAFYGGDIPWVKIGDLTDGPVGATEQTITEAGLDASTARWLPADTVLVAMYGSIGKLGILEMAATTNQAICAMQPGDKLDRDYLFWFLMASREHLMSLGRGGTQRNIGQKDLRALRLPLPPLAEQREVVEELRGQLARVDEGLGHFRRAARQVHEFRRALLDQVLGHCVAPVADTGSRTHDRPALPDLPRGWSWSTVGAEGFVQLGRMLSHDRHTGEHTHPYLRVANVLDNRLDLTDVKEMDFPPGEYERYLLHPGDILLNEGQSPELLGRAAMYRGERPGLCFQKTLLRWQAGERVTAEFALLVFRHYLYAGRFRRESRITTGIGHLTGVRFSAMEFPVPPMSEQRRIVAVTQRQLDEVDGVERSFLAAEQQADDLRASLMVEAFAGRLHADTRRQRVGGSGVSSNQKDRRAVLVGE